MAVSLLERGSKWLRAQLPDAAAQTVEIRAGNSVLEVMAVPGRHNFQQYVVEEAAGTDEVFDWVVSEQDLVFPSQGKLQPAADWEIRWLKEDGRTAVFSVRPSTGARAFDVVDNLGLLYRIHTQFDRFEQ